jgi:Uma2 family endonuclease
MAGEPLLEQLVRSPKLGIYVQKMQDILAQEQHLRDQFYASITEDDKAEFINGRAIFHSPVKLKHNNASILLLVLLRAYVNMHHLGFVGHEKILISLTRNDYEPDICFFSRAKSDRFERNQMRFPAPDFIAEVLSDSTEAYDRDVKFEDYAAHGVSEYWIIDPEAETVEQYALRDEAYTLLFKVNSGNLQSVAVPGFDIPVRAIFDEAENLRALQQIVA